MLHYLIGRAGTGKTTRLQAALLDEIRLSARPVVLLVPEQQTVAWETRMAALLPPSANLRLEITNFTRLANAVFREYGGLADPVIDEGSRVLLVWRAMLSVWDRLRVYRSGTSGGREDRNLPRLLAAVDELKASGISPADAERGLDELIRLRDEEGAGDAASGDLVSRLSDAVLVYAAYEELLHGGASIDRGDLFDNLIRTLREHPYFRGKAVFIDSFFTLTSPEERIFDLILAQSDEVWATFACPPPSGDDPLDEVQFGEIRAYLKTALRLAARHEKPVETIPLTENLRHRDVPLLARVEKHLFRYAEDLPAPEPVSGPSPVELIRCSDLYDEAEACASLIDRLLDEGYACREIAVAAENIRTREGITDAALRAHGIPCFLSESSEISRSPAVRLMLAALSVEAGGWQRRDVIRLLKTGLTAASGSTAADDDSPLGPFAENVFETYTATWNIRGRRSFVSGPWTMNPAGYKTEIPEAGREMLRLANAVKDALVPPLDRLLAVFRSHGGAAPVPEIAEALVNFAEENDLEGRLRSLAEASRASGLLREAELAVASWGAVCQILDKMVTLLGDTALDAGRFGGLLARCAAAMDAGTIPTGMDEVVLGSASGVRFDGVKCVILLGCVEGEFPGSPDGGSSFFDERDKLLLESAGLNVAEPNDAMRTAREYFMFYRTAASAEERLFLLCPTGTSGALSDGALRIDRILAGEDATAVKTFADAPLDEVVYHPRSAEYLLSRRADRGEIDLLSALTDGAGRPLRRASVPLSAEHDRLPVGARESSPTMRLSQTGIETFLSCPFRYACKTRIRLAEEARAQITAADVGNFVHGVLEKYFAASTGRETDEERRELAEEIIRDYIDALGRATGGDLSRDGRLLYLFERLSRHVKIFLAAITKELAQSEFRPAAEELPIGLNRPGAAQPIRIRIPDGATVTLDGVADRVDTWTAPDGRQYLRVVDYKTGAKTFSMERVARGLDVQVLIYLFALWKNGLPTQKNGASERVPAAAVYFSVRPSPPHAETLVSEEDAARMAEAQIERVGVYLDDADALRAMDRELGGTFAPLKTDKEGRITALGKSELVSLERFGEIYEQMNATIGQIAGQIRSGEAAARPRRTGAALPCEYCNLKAVCRKT